MRRANKSPQRSTTVRMWRVSLLEKPCGRTTKRMLFKGSAASGFTLALCSRYTALTSCSPLFKGSALRALPSHYARADPALATCSPLTAFTLICCSGAGEGI